MNRTRWHLQVGAVVFAWLLALLVVAAAHQLIPLYGWLLIHLLGLGAAGNAILIWSRHFTDALLRRPPEPTRTAEVALIAAFNAGAVAVVVGMLTRCWPAMLAGGTVIAIVVLTHGVTLLRQLRAALPSRFGITVRYYVAATVCLAVGAGLGVAMGNSSLSGVLHERFVLAHALVNMLGWLGLMVLGTLVTLWPTMLRTRMAEGVERAAGRGLPTVLAALAMAVGGAGIGSPLISAAGTAGYLGAAGLILWPHLDEARRKHPGDFATQSVSAGVLWLIGCLAVATVELLTAPTWPAAVAAVGTLTVPMLAGVFGAGAAGLADLPHAGGDGWSGGVDGGGRPVGTRCAGPDHRRQHGPVARRTADTASGPGRGGHPGDRFLRGLPAVVDPGGVAGVSGARYTVDSRATAGGSAAATTRSGRGGVGRGGARRCRRGSGRPLGTSYPCRTDIQSGGDRAHHRRISTRAGDAVRPGQRAGARRRSTAHHPGQLGHRSS